MHSLGARDAGCVQNLRQISSTSLGNPHSHFKADIRPDKMTMRVSQTGRGNLPQILPQALAPVHSPCLFQQCAFREIRDPISQPNALGAGLMLYSWVPEICLKFCTQMHSACFFSTEFAEKDKANALGHWEGRLPQTGRGNLPQILHATGPCPSAFGVVFSANSVACRDP